LHNRKENRMPFDREPVTNEEVMPCAFGLLFDTLALMTAHAAPEAAPHLDATIQRHLMARKIVSNLHFLQHHPDAPPPLRQVAVSLHARWLPMATTGDRAVPVATGEVVPAGTQWH
jgi:hypothetical protein